MKNTEKKSSAWAIRWAAIGAAVAVTLGAGGLVGVDAVAPGSETGNSGEFAFIPIDPVRFWDSRVDKPGGGEIGPLYDAVPLQLDFSEFLYEVEGVDQDYLVDAVVLNVTVPGKSANMSGYVSVTPSLCNLVGVDDPTYACLENIYANEAAVEAGGPTRISSVNWGYDGPSTANMVTVGLGEYDTDAPSTIDIVMIGRGDGPAGTREDAVANVVVDIVGFYSTNCEIDVDIGCSGG
ncbi:MAG: hypothetical protein P8O03_10610 [Ilumatobacter sp.]|nr:hypothetical protein [Ilumatobacter sp.]